MLQKYKYHLLILATIIVFVISYKLAVALLSFFGAFLVSREDKIIREIEEIEKESASLRDQIEVYKQEPKIDENEVDDSWLDDGL